MDLSVDARHNQPPIECRKTLLRLGVVAGYYEAAEFEYGTRVTAMLVFRNGGRMTYRKYHGRSSPVPDAVALARMYRYIKSSK